MEDVPVERVLTFAVGSGDDGATRALGRSGFVNFGANLEIGFELRRGVTSIMSSSISTRGSVVRDVEVIIADD
jgi:hypothetical protein